MRGTTRSCFGTWPCSSSPRTKTAVLAAQRGREGGLERLSDIPELLLTLGFRGAEIRVGGAVTRVAPDRVIEGVQTTGAGDAFMIAYLIDVIAA